MEPNHSSSKANQPLRRRLLRGAVLCSLALLVRQDCDGAASAQGGKSAVELPNTTDCGPGRPDNNCTGPATGTCLNDSGVCRGSETICRFEWKTSGSCGNGGHCGAGGYCQCPAGTCGASCENTCPTGQVCLFEQCVKDNSPGDCATTGCGPGEECRGGVCASVTDPCRSCLPTQRCQDGRCVDKPQPGCSRR